ncbi:hypothetical protein GCM10020221_20250 [Streptomyces thioluteus]|uniref:Uncharacterized protein n=1 Tax=Streptomyces thioluteus TaxID=66431 RepID=A0ABP6JAI8_STRTU
MVGNERRAGGRYALTRCMHPRELMTTRGVCTMTLYTMMPISLPPAALSAICMFIAVGTAEYHSFHAIERADHALAKNDAMPTLTLRPLRGLYCSTESWLILVTRPSLTIPSHVHNLTTRLEPSA